MDSPATHISESSEAIATAAFIVCLAENQDLPSLLSFPVVTET